MDRNITRTFDLLTLYRTSYRMEDAFAGKVNGNWEKLSNEDYVEQADCFSCGLLDMGFKPGEKIAIISNNRPEWNVADMGMAQIGVISVPIYPTSSFDDFLYILRHSSPRAVMVSDKILYEKLKHLVQDTPDIELIYTFSKVSDAHHWAEILEAGFACKERRKDELERRKAAVLPDDLFTLIYTSGTTGLPKGVMLSHRNLCSNAMATARLNTLGFGQKALSILPLCHIYERMMNYHFQFKGISIYYAENMGTVLKNCQEVRPHIFITMPRTLERFYDECIVKAKSASRPRKFLFFWAVNQIAVRFSRIRYRKNPWYRLKVNLARKLVFKPCTQSLGGRLKVIVSGDTTLQPRLRRFFESSNIQLVEGYGMTETSPVISVGNPLVDDFIPGTSGPVLPGVEVKLTEEGEILCKGPNVMLGYYKDPELTAEVIDDEGWFHTGDVGLFLEGRFLKVTGRKKERFKLYGGGEWISPHSMETRIKESNLIDSAMVVGDGQPFLTVLFSPDFSYLHQWASLHDVSFSGNADLIRNPVVIERYKQELALLNKEFSPREQILDFRLVPDEWGIASGELSPTLKLKRKLIFDKYRDLIRDMYRPDETYSL